MNDGTAKIWGRNMQGLNNGSGVVTNWTTPTTIASLANVQQISTLPTDTVAADNHVLVLLKDGTVKGWGSNQFGMLGSLSSSVSTHDNNPGIVRNHLGGCR